MSKKTSQTPWPTVIIEDQLLLLSVLCKRIELDPRFQLVGSAETGKAGIDVCLKAKPALVVTDIRLPDTDGLDVVKKLLAQIETTRFLVLSNLNDPFTLSRLQEIGVHGFVEKDQPIEILEEAMVEVASGRTYFTADLYRCWNKLGLNPTSFKKFLSEREQQIVALVAEGMPNSEIAKQLNLRKRSIETYRYRIMKRLNITTAAALIRYYYEQAEDRW